MNKADFPLSTIETKIIFSFTGVNESIIPPTRHSEALHSDAPFPEHQHADYDAHRLLIKWEHGLGPYQNC